MTALVKAVLAEMPNGVTDPARATARTEVQFNPTSLRIQYSNRTAGGQQSGAQGRQRPGTGEVQLSFDLVFDTADEGSAEQPVNVLEKTRLVERFVRPRGNRAGQETPPRVLFEWGSCQVQGVMDSTNVDLDFFSAGGVPLRAKVSVTIKGQDAALNYTPSPNPPGAAQAASGAPGRGGGTPAIAQVVQAQRGTNLPALASQLGLPPELWRALASGVPNVRNLVPGQEVQVPADVRGAPASGQAAAGNDPDRATARLPLLDPAPGGSAAAPDAVAQGQALTKQGGLDGAIQQLRSAQHREAAAGNRSAFGVASRLPDAEADATDRPWGQGVPLRPRFGGSPAPARRGGGLPSDRPRSAPRLRPTCGCGCGGRCGCH